MMMSRTITQNSFCHLEVKQLWRSCNNIFRLTLTDDGGFIDQHLLNPDRISSLRSCLQKAKEEAEAAKPRGSVLITTGKGDYFSGGFDFRWAREDSNANIRAQRFGKMNSEFKGLIQDLVSLPMPTIAAINGYAFGSGLMLGISHDYLTMANNNSKPMKMEFLSKGMSLPKYCAALIRSKLGSPSAQRCLVLRELQFGAKEAVGLGLMYENADRKVEGLGGEDGDPVKSAEHLAEELLQLEVNGRIYAEARKALYPELCQELGLKSTFTLSNL